MLLHRLETISQKSQNEKWFSVKKKAHSAILSQKGYYPAFHMNKKCWVSIILEDALSDEEIQNRIRFGFETV